MTSEAVTENSSNLDYDGSNKGHGSFQSGSMEASYEIDTLRLVTMSFGLWGGGNKSNGSTDYIATFPENINAAPIYSYSAFNRSKSSWYSIDGGVDYQRLFKVKDRMLTFSYKINTRPQTSDSYTEYEIDKGYNPDWADYLKRLRNLHNDGEQNTTEHTFQADYTTPIGKLHTLEAGAKYILRNNSSEDDRFDADDTGKYEYNKEQSSHYKHLNDIIAAYLGYGLKVKRLSGRLGVRYEHTIQDVKYLVGRGEDFTKNFDDVVPSASIRLANGTLNWVTDGLNGYIESRPAIDHERIYIGTWGAMFYAIDRKTGKKVWEFDTERGRYFSPGACWPTVLPYRKNGKASEQVIVLSSDYFVRAFNPEDGKILWASDEAKGRESIGFSPDGKTMYIKGIKNNITAADVSKGNYTPLWNTLMPYEGNFIPTRMETTEEYVFIPTEFGVVHAVRTDGSGIAWSHKVSHSAVTSLKKAGDHRLIVMTMDGTVTCLIYP